ncbi:MAG: hypothetical protein WC971_09370 [Coriobacteriia bacterium]
MAGSKWSLRNIYLYLVCLITLIMVIFATVNLVRAIVELAYPDPGFPITFAPEKGGAVTAADARIQKEQQRIQQQQSRRQAVLSLVAGIAMLGVAGPLYIYHWRKIEAENVPTDT